MNKIIRLAIILFLSAIIVLAVFSSEIFSGKNDITTTIITFLIFTLILAAIFYIFYMMYVLFTNMRRKLSNSLAKEDSNAGEGFENTGKKKLIASGILLSFVIFIICTGVIFWLLSNIHGEAGFILLPFVLSPLLGIAAASIPFIILNTIFLIFIPNGNIRRGLGWGYLFISIYAVFFIIIYMHNYSTTNALNKNQQAINENNEKVCEQIKIPSTLNSSQEYSAADCFEKIAEQKKDISICAKIVGKSAVSVVSKTNCYTNIAISLKNVSICDKLINGNDRDQCIEEVSVVRGDTFDCPRIKTPVIMKECFDYAIKNK